MSPNAVSGLSGELAGLAARAACLKERLQRTPALPQAARSVRNAALARGARAAVALDGGAVSLESMTRLAENPASGMAALAETRSAGLLRAFFHVNSGAGLALTFEALGGLHDLMGAAGAGAWAGEEFPGGGQGEGLRHDGARDAMEGTRRRRETDALLAWLSGLDQGGVEDPVYGVLRPALAHYHLLRIAPFQTRTGAGALARLVEAALSQAPGLFGAQALLQEYYYRRFEEYQAASPPPGSPGGPQDDRLAPFLALALKGQIQCYGEVLDEVTRRLRILVMDRHISDLRETRRLTLRQHDLLRMLLAGDTPVISIANLMRRAPFSALYGRASEQTARRDIRRLEELGLFRREHDGLRLNMDCLDMAGVDASLAGESA